MSLNFDFITVQHCMCLTYTIILRHISVAITERKSVSFRMKITSCGPVEPARLGLPTHTNTQMQGRLKAVSSCESEVRWVKFVRARGALVSHVIGLCGEALTPNPDQAHS